MMLALCGLLHGAQADRLAAMEALISDHGQQLLSLREELASLRAENAALRKIVDSRRLSFSSGEGGRTHITLEGRQLSSSSGAGNATCCRWTHDMACGTVEHARLRECTGLHEYLENKVTSVEFEDLDECLGSDAEGWGVSFEPTASGGGHVTLKQNGAVVATPLTPLRVTYPANCSGVPPTLTVQLATVFPQIVSFNGGAEVNGMDIEQSSRHRILRCRAPSGSSASGKCTRKESGDIFKMGTCNMECARRAPECLGCGPCTHTYAR